MQISSPSSALENIECNQLALKVSLMDPIAFNEIPMLRLNVSIKQGES